MKKLIVQDTDQHVLENLRNALELAGFDVLTTTSYNDILVQIDLFKPHVVMLNFKLTNEECKSACMLIKTNYPNLPVLALTYNVNINSEYEKHGFDGYIPHPFDLKELYAILRKYIPDLNR